jgi:ATP-dependent DNA helicase PIF1
MLDGNLFNELESMARQIRQDKKVFGGIQLILTGDFCQLPPVIKRSYCFETEAWSKCITQTVNLTQVYRQKSN